MGFNISNWFQRRRIDAQVRMSGRPVEHRRISNPFHAVSIEPGPRPCAEARSHEGRRYLSSAAPMLPLRGCTQLTCQCRYSHYKDRRIQEDRRVNFINPRAHSMSERRAGTGRRFND